MFFSLLGNRFFFLFCKEKNYGGREGAASRTVLGRGGVSQPRLGRATPLPAWLRPPPAGPVPVAACPRRMLANMVALGSVLGLALPVVLWADASAGEAARLSRSAAPRALRALSPTQAWAAAVRGRRPLPGQQS